MIQENINLKQHNTFGIEVNARRFATFSSIEELRSLLSEKNDDSLLILGGGSNILFTKDFNGLVIKNEIKGFEIVDETEKFVHVKVGAGEVWHEFVLKCIELDYGGVENLSLIPGSVGASPMQNIGAYGTEIKDIFIQLEAYKIDNCEIHIFNNEDCEFGYRESVFKKSLKDQYVIVSVTYRLTKEHLINSNYGAIENELTKRGITHATIRDISDSVIAIRSSKLPDPKKIGNAGSFFKNPIVDHKIVKEIAKNYHQFPHYPAPNGKVKLAAGWLIEQAGWKGKTFGNFGVHKLQALVLVNYSESKGDEIYDLSTRIITSVKEQFGITLEREVNII